MLVWVPDIPERPLVGELPDGVEVVPQPADPATDARRDEVEVVVVKPGPEWEALAPALGSLASLRLVQTFSAGVDWLADDVPDGVTLCSARGIHDGPVAEWTLGAILAVRRGFIAARDRAADGDWDPQPTADLEGATVLIAGYGSIGEALEARLAPLGPEVLRLARHAREGVHGADALPELLARAEIMVLLLPHTDATEQVIDADALARMPDGALLVNVGRGELVDTDALLAELRRGRLHAALDVTDPEPLPPEHPLWDEPGCLITPHVAGLVARLDARAMRLAGDQLRALAAGREPVNVVQGEY